MATKVYGASDDLIEFEGDVSGEVGYYGDDDGAMIVMPDGTLLVAKYGKPGNLAVWSIDVIRKGTHFDRIDLCTDEDADPYSDVAHFKDGMPDSGFVATKWQRVD